MLIPKSVMAVSATAARESTRYAINGVHLEREADGRCHAVTTDGRQLLDVSWSDEDMQPNYPTPAISGNPAAVPGSEMLIERGVWDRAAKAIPKRTYKPVLETVAVEETGFDSEREEGKDARKITLETTDMDGCQRFDTREHEGRFPQWRDVVPDPKAGQAVEIGVNPELMANLLKAVCKCACDEESKGVRLTIPTDPKRPLKIAARRSDGVEATGVLMPVNMEASPGDDILEASPAQQALVWLIWAVHSKDPAEQTRFWNRAMHHAREALDASGWDIEANLMVPGNFGPEAPADPEPVAESDTEATPEPAPIPAPALTVRGGKKPAGTCEHCGGVTKAGKKFCGTDCYLDWLKGGGLKRRRAAG